MLPAEGQEAPLGAGTETHSGTRLKVIHLRRQRLLSPEKPSLPHRRFCVVFHVLSTLQSSTQGMCVLGKQYCSLSSWTLSCWEQMGCRNRRMATSQGQLHRATRTPPSQVPWDCQRKVCSSCSTRHWDLAITHNRSLIPLY